MCCEGEDRNWLREGMQYKRDWMERLSLNLSIKNGKIIGNEISLPLMEMDVVNIKSIS